MGGFFSSLFGGQVKPYTPQPTFGSNNQDALVSAILQKVLYGGQLRGVQPYPGQINPNMGGMLLPQVYGQYAQGNPAIQAMIQQQQPNSQISQSVNQMLNQGALSGNVGNLMGNMVNYGGAGAGANYMSNLAQYGAPSAAGTPLAQMAQGYGPAISMLQPFLANANKVPGAQGGYFTTPQDKTVG